MLIVRNLKLSLEYSDTEIIKKLARKLGTYQDNINSYSLYKLSLDSRDKTRIFYNAQFLVDAVEYKESKDIDTYTEKVLSVPKVKTNDKVCIIGFGPSSIFAAYILSQSGVSVDIYERGEAIEDRDKTVDTLLKDKILNTNSNVQFGEGGAGTYSDGKLNTRSKSEHINYVYKTLIKYGASKEIMYVNNPHIGTDKLKDIIIKIRKELLKSVNIHFNSLVTDINISNNKFKSITVNDKELQYDHCIMGLGNASRDTFTMLHNKGVALESKPLSMGFRIEHLASFISDWQYKSFKDKLPNAEYKLTAKVGDKGVYSFCMCPGGYVIPSQTEDNTVCVNGMSYNGRNNVNSNSAIVCQIDASSEPLGNIDLQREIEQKAFELAGSNYNVPVQLTSDFLDNKTTTTLKSVKPSYDNYTLTNMNNIYSKDITESLKKGLLKMNNQIKGFAHNDSILVGVETRTSCPIRILRDKVTYQSINTNNLYPIGEGAGYAGGITSSAVDGVKAALALINNIK